jgi:hypothetical protein
VLAEVKTNICMPIEIRNPVVERYVNNLREKKPFRQ